MTTNISKAYELLDSRIQYWVWTKQWTELRDIQEQAIPEILQYEQDVILSSATASGKTEAAFLPILTHMLKREQRVGLTLYISPLVALINDQYMRLSELCETLEIPVHPWHGGISSHRKKKVLTTASGVLLITPESLQALFCNHGWQIKYLVSEIQFIVIDELHNFIGSDRGKQLQTLMHLIDLAAERKVPRIGLSATLGDMDLAARYIRPNKVAKVLVSNAPADLKLLVKGYIETKAGKDSQLEHLDVESRIANDLFPVIRHSNNLIFPNSRNRVEYYTKILSEMSEKNAGISRFYAHHGNLSHTIRSEAEEAIKISEYPTTIICTNTLELGIDIGSVESIIQIGSPPAVSSLRQRLGRSGREEGKPRILRAFTVGVELDGTSSLLDELRIGPIELCAMITLLLKGWCEPPKLQALNASTLVQQVLSLISQHGGITAHSAFQILCSSGPFSTITKGEFADLLRALGEKELISQDPTGILFHGAKGERIVNHYSFYAAFETPIEYRIISDTKVLGTLPIDTLLVEGDYILFAGKSWVVEIIDPDKRTIVVSPRKKGKPPVFLGDPGFLHTEIRKTMREIYRNNVEIKYVDRGAIQMIQEGQDAYVRYGLEAEDVIQAGSAVYIFTWLGDEVNETLCAILRWQGYRSYRHGLAIILEGATKESIVECLNDLKTKKKPSISKLLQSAVNLERSKWDWALSRELLEKSYVSHYMDLDATWEWIQNR